MRQIFFVKSLIDYATMHGSGVAQAAQICIYMRHR